MNLKSFLLALGALVIAGGPGGNGTPGAAPLAAQGATPPDGIHGVVVDQESGAPVRGATVLLFRGASERVEGAFTDDEGGFRLRSLPRAGDRLLVERLGFRAVELPVDVAALAQGAPLRIPLPSQAIALEGVTASADRRCELNPLAGTDTFELWELARTGLRAAALTSAEELVRFRISTWVREVDREGNIRSSRAESIVEMSGVPFAADDPEVLAEEGFVRRDGPELVAFGPDADVLLSDAFVRTHCFRVAGRNPEDPGLIGLAFEPVPGHEPIDIAGTLWIDVATGALQSVEFAYVRGGFPYGSGSGGRIDFFVLDHGPWVVRNWVLRLQAGVRGGVVVYDEGGGRLLSILSTETGDRRSEAGT